MIHVLLMARLTGNTRQYSLNLQGIIDLESLSRWLTATTFSLIFLLQSKLQCFNISPRAGRSQLDMTKPTQPLTNVSTHITVIIIIINIVIEWIQWTIASTITRIILTTLLRYAKCIEGNLRLKEAISRLIISKKLNANIDLKLYSAILSLHNIHAQNMTLERGKTLNMSDKSMEIVAFKHVICKKLNNRYACRKRKANAFGSTTVTTCTGR